MTRRVVTSGRQAGKSMAMRMAAAMAATEPTPAVTTTFTVDGQFYAVGDKVLVTADGKSVAYEVTADNLKPAGNRHQRRKSAALSRKTR